MKDVIIVSSKTDGDYTEVKLERTQAFLDHLQDFVSKTGAARIDHGGVHSIGSKSYDPATFAALHDASRARPIGDIADGTVIRYSHGDFELLVVFTGQHVILLFHATDEQRGKIMRELLSFARFHGANA